MQPLFFPAVFTQKIVIILAVGEVSIHLAASRLNFSGCFLARSLNVYISLILSASRTQPTGVAVWGTLSRCWGSPELGWLCFLSYLQGPGGPHSSLGVSASWDIPGWSLLSLCGLLILFSRSEPKISQEVKASGVFLPCIRWDLETDKLSQPARFLISSLDNNSIIKNK